jgi:hypothetical protein
MKGLDERYLFTVLQKRCPLADVWLTLEGAIAHPSVLRSGTRTSGEVAVCSHSRVD